MLLLLCHKERDLPAYVPPLWSGLKANQRFYATLLTSASNRTDTVEKNEITLWRCNETINTRLSPTNYLTVSHCLPCYSDLLRVAGAPN